MSPRLSIIPAGAVTDAALEPRDLRVLCLLGRHSDRDSGWCRRSQVKMAKEISCGRATLQRSLERLVDAGWVQKKQWNVPEGAEPGQPSASYLYRVILDRDDFEVAEREDHEDDDAASHALDASESAEGVPTSGHPRAHPDGHPVPTHARAPRTTLSNEQSERDARAKDRKARFIVDFEARWPTSGADSRQRTAYAADALSEDEERAALDGIAPFLELLKRLKRKHVPAGFTYLEEKRWTALEQKPPEAQGGYYAAGSREVIALERAYGLGGKASYFRDVMLKPGVGVFYPRPIEPRLLALAAAPPPDDWPVLDHRQAAAWEEFLQAVITVQTRSRLRDGARAPWPWPPRKDGTLATAPPADADDEAALANEGMR